VVERGVGVAAGGKIQFPHGEKSSDQKRGIGSGDGRERRERSL